MYGFNEKKSSDRDDVGDDDAGDDDDEDHDGDAAEDAAAATLVGGGRRGHSRHSQPRPWPPSNGRKSRRRCAREAYTRRSENSQ